MGIVVMTKLGATMHRWTEEEHDLLRARYAGNRASCEKLGATLGVSWLAVRARVSKLGLARITSRKSWTAGEDAQLEQEACRRPMEAIAKSMDRSVNSVVVRSKRLGLHRRDRDGWYTKTEVCEILGVQHRWLQARIDSKALRASWHHGRHPHNAGAAAWHISEANLKRYIRTYPDELNGRNVDLVQVVDVLAGVISAERADVD